MEKNIESYPSRPRLLAAYRTLLRLSHRRGAGMLSRFHARMFPGGERITHWCGAEMILPGDPHFFGYLMGHEQHITSVIRELVRPGDTCVDVGANIGYFSTLLAGAVGPTGQVICYEPESRNFKSLDLNAALASRKGLHITAVKAAVSNQPGTVQLEVGGQSTSHHILHGQTSNVVTESVPAVNLADDLRARGITQFVRFLKMDVEGHEVPALEGASDWFASRSVGTAIIEVEAGENAQSVEQLIAKWKATASFYHEGQWHTRPISQIPGRVDVRIDFAQN